MNPTGRPTGGGDLAAPLGSASGGRLVFANGVTHVTVHADPAIPELYRARFQDHLPRVDTDGGTVTIRYPRTPLLSDLRDLAHKGGPADEITLNGSIPWHIEIHRGAEELTADLRGLQLRSFQVDGGAGHVVLVLPSPLGVVPVRVSQGVHALTVHRPAGAAARVRVRRGARNLRFDEQSLGAVGGETSLASPGYEHATDRYDIDVAGGASNLEVRS